MPEGYNCLIPVEDLFIRSMAKAKIVFGEIYTAGKVRSLMERGEGYIDITDPIESLKRSYIEIANRYNLAVRLVQAVLSPGACPPENLELLLKGALEKVDEIFEETKSIALNLEIYDIKQEQNARNAIYEIVNGTDRPQN